MAKIVAIVSIDKDSVAGGAPIFIEPDEHNRESTAFMLEKILDATVHDLKNGSFVLVNHRAE
jgi:hypothetical protein